MNKKATYYVFKGLKALIVLIRKDLKNLIGVLVFGITSMFGKLFYISFPIYAFGEYNLISNYNENNELDLSLIFEDSKSSKNYWTTVRFMIKSHVFTFVGLVMTLLFCYGLVQFGIGYGELYSGQPQTNSIFLQVTSGMIILLFFICRNIIIEPITYFLWEQEDIELVEAMKQRRVFKSEFLGLKLFVIQISFFIMFIIWAIVASLIVYLMYKYYFYYFWKVVFISLTSIVLLVILAMLQFSYKVASVNLFADFKQIYKSNNRNVQDKVVSSLEIKFKEEALHKFYNNLLEDNKEIIHEYETRVIEKEEETDNIIDDSSDEIPIESIEEAIEETEIVAASDLQEDSIDDESNTVIEETLYEQTSPVFESTFKEEQIGNDLLDDTDEGIDETTEQAESNTPVDEAVNKISDQVESNIEDNDKIVEERTEEFVNKISEQIESNVEDDEGIDETTEQVESDVDNKNLTDVELAMNYFSNQTKKDTNEIDNSKIKKTKKEKNGLQKMFNKLSESRKASKKESLKDEMQSFEEPTDIDMIDKSGVESPLNDETLEIEDSKNDNIVDTKKE